MSTLRSQDSVSSACYNRNKNLSVLRQGRRDLKLSLQRVIPEPTGFIESPRLSPRSYLERYETFYSQLNDMNVTKDTVDSILFTVFKNTSRRQFPPMTELIMSKTLLKLLSMAPTFDISQNKMILLILQNVTGFDTIYTNELLSMDVLTFLLHSIKEPKLVDSVSFVLVNICVDSPETARKLLKLGLNTFLLNYLTASQVMSYPIIWLLRCLLHNSENVEPFFLLIPLFPLLLKNENSDMVMAACCILIEFATRKTYVQPFEDAKILDELVSLVVNLTTKDKALKIISLKTLQHLTIWATFAPVENRILTMIEEEEREENFYTKKLYFFCVANTVHWTRNTSLILSIISSNPFKKYFQRILLFDDEEMRCSVIQIILYCIHQTPQNSCFSFLSIPGLPQALVSISLKNTDLLRLSLQAIEKLSSTLGDPMISILLESRILNWFDSILISQQPEEILSLAQSLSSSFQGFVSMEF